MHECNTKTAMSLTSQLSSEAHAEKDGEYVYTDKG